MFRFCRRLARVWEYLILIGAGLVIFATDDYGQTNSQAFITVSAGQPGASISSNLFGIFFEEISSAGDGGLYAELDRNRSFEDSTNSIPDWTLVTNGSATGQMSLDTSLPLSATNLQALKLTKSSGTGSIGAVNGGYWGISLTAGATYNLGFYARGASGFSGFVSAALESAGGAIYAQGSVLGLTTNWQHFTLSLVPNQTDPAAQLLLEIAQTGTIYLDFVSLFPTQTFNDRTNGLRPDLAAMLVRLKPSFVRFPGGSWIDGDSLADAYHWEPTVGNPANRVLRYDLWGYVVDNGLGYHEYLQMCEDIGALPLFAINCGMDVNQDAVPTNQLGPWVQEAVDAIAYATDDTNTAWGSQRAANGHPAPFNLQFMEIGNENNGSAYNANYSLFYTAIKSNYPFMHLIANSQGTIPTSSPVEIVDEHYYTDQATFISYATKYDSYSRAGPKVFVGEYAVTAGSGNGNLAGALGEAAFMTGLERNSDLVEMASYAPLFANLSNKDWNPDLIYFTGTQVYGTPSYYVQQMFSLNRGDYVLPATVVVSTNIGNSVVHGAIGLGSWNTSVQYTNIVVTSNGSTLYQSDFVDDGTNGWSVYNGTWGVANGLYQQTAVTTDCYSTTGDTNWSNYTISLQARKVGGDEGFLILFNVLDDQDWTWWNIGGWSDTLDGIEQTVGGNKTTYAQVPQFIALNTWYDIRIVLTGPRIQCYLGTNAAQAATNLVQDVTLSSSPGGLLVSSSYAKAAGQIIVKAVNAYNAPVAATINVPGLTSIASNATVIQLTSGSAADENSLTAPTYVFPVTNAINNAGTNFTLTLPANSLSILRLNASGFNSYTNLMVQCPSPIGTGQLVAATVLGLVSGNWSNLTANANHAITWSSANTNIAAVDINGNVSGVGPGTTSIIATYASLGLSATQAVQVIYIPTMLVHRYSFKNGTANDSVGSANGTLAGNASISGGQLVLPNTTSAAPATDYLQLPSGILNNPLNGPGTNANDSAVSVEAWASIKSGQYTWANLFDFGNRDSSGNAEYDIHVCVHSSDNATIAGISDSDNANVDYQYIDLGAGTSLDGSTNVHITAVFNPPAAYVALYLNGVLAGANNNLTIPMSGVQAVRNIIGADNWPDPGMQGTIGEFRIYSGALQAAEIAATQALGPNQLLSTASPVISGSATGGNLTLAWPLAAAGFILESSTNLAANAWTSVPATPQIIASQWQVTVPQSGNAQFFRLTR
jgi:alpha-L-arabinofuranosidase